MPETYGVTDLSEIALLRFLGFRFVGAACNDDGVVTVQFANAPPANMDPIPCDVCAGNGQGETPGKSCLKCDGTGRLNANAETSVGAHRHSGIQVNSADFDSALNWAKGRVFGLRGRGRSARP